MNYFKDLYSKSSLAVLSLVDSDLSVSKTTIRSTLKPIMKRKGNCYFDQIYKQLCMCFKDSKVIGRTLPACFLVINSTARMIMQYNYEITALEKEIKTISDTLESVTLLRTLPGIGQTISTSIVAEIGNIDNFKNSKALVAFCGLDPGVKQSGAYNKDHNKVSKRGAPELRRMLYMASVISVTKHKNNTYNNKVIYDYYHEKLKSKPGKVAMGAVMHKLVRIIYSVLKNRKEFEMISRNQQCLLYKNQLECIA